MTEGGTVVLAVGAHPDDVDAFCGGTLALLARRGVAVHVAIATGGEGGIPGADPESAREIRLAEARRAGSWPGRRPSTGWGWSTSRRSRPWRRASGWPADHIRRIGANLLVSHPPGDYHADHRAVAELVLAMRIGACAANVGTEPPLQSAPDLASCS